MAKDRLLSDETVCIFTCGESKCRTTDGCEAFFNHRDIAKAQLALTDADWVEWVEVHIVKGQNAIFKDCVVINPSELEERKRSVGL